MDAQRPQRFDSIRVHDSAASSVISTILMVALTIFLTGTIFWLVSDFTESHSVSALAISWEVNDENDRLMVVVTEEQGEWSRIDVRVTSCVQADGAAAVGRVGTAAPYHNTAAAPTGAALNQAASAGTTCGPGSFVNASPNALMITTGDYLAFCSSPAGADMIQIHVQIRDAKADAILRNVAFADWADC